MEFKANPLSVDDCLRLRRKYVIPRFQREYSWENDELQTIWEDMLDSLYFDGSNVLPQEYFIGSLVLVGDDDSSDINRYIVDGQQRLMTFTIAFSVLTQAFKKAGEEKLRDATFSYIIAQDSDGNEYAKLVAENPKPFFQFRIQQQEPDLTISPSNQEENRILDAYLFFERHFESNNFIEEMEKRQPGITEKVSYIDMLKAFRNQILFCKVVYVTVKSYDDAYTIFEVLNAKGKDLTAIDIIKNSIFSILDKQEPVDFALEKWKVIRDNIAKCDEGIITFYRHFWLSKYGFSTVKKLVKDFNRYIPKDIASYTNFMNSLEHESQTYCRIVSPNENEGKHPQDLKAWISLEALSIFNTSQVRTFLLALFEARENKRITHRNFVNCLESLERFHFIFTAICSSRASGLERRYSSFARRMRSCENKNETMTCVRELVFALQETLPSYDIFESKIMLVQYTSEKSKQKKLVQYILRKIETFYAGSLELKPFSFTIEHIVSESTRAPFVGHLGNLIPLGETLNNDVANKPFKEKLEHYKESRYVTVKKFVELYSQINQFHKNDIEERTKELAGILYTDIWEH